MTTPETSQAAATASSSGLDADERQLAELLRGQPTPEPSAALDARILDMAQAALASTAEPRGSESAAPISLSSLRVRRRRRWGWGMGAAAAAVLSALMLAPHWLDPNADMAGWHLDGMPLPSAAPASPPMADPTDRLQPAQTSDAATSDTGVETARLRGITAERAAESVPMPVESAPSAAVALDRAVPLPKQELPGRPSIPAPAPSAAAPPPPPEMANAAENAVEATVVGEASPDVMEEPVIAPEPMPTRDDEHTARRATLPQREESPGALLSAPANAASAKPNVSGDLAPMPESPRPPFAEPDDPALTHIRKLIAGHHTGRALAAMDEWQRQHPAKPLPEDLRAWRAKQIK